MNISQFWTSKVNEIMTTGRIKHASAWGQAALIYPDAAILMRAAGQTRHAVQFANAKLAAEATRPSAESRRQFTKDVQDEMKTTGCNHGTAFNRVYGRNPQFANSQAGPKVTPPTNSADGVPALTPELKAIYRLPSDTTSSEWTAASKANLRMGSMVNFGKVFDALCELAQKEKSLDYENALRATKSRFSDLWAAVEALSVMPA